MSAPTTQKPSALTLDFLPYVDMSTLSQSELRSLSSCSSSDHFRPDNIVTPSVDRSLFNESTGSHRQTYSRPSSSRHRLTKSPNPNPNNPLVGSDRGESLCIISFLKKFLSDHPEFRQFNSFNAAINKRKRGKGNTGERGVEVEIVNKNGVVVDVETLEGSEDLYKEELRRRTDGMDKEEELLGFFSGLGGEWCSRRKKRKIVDADEFGDALPVGWKLLLALRRKDGRASVYCRRYVSPGGQHFASCKEVSKYLQSFFEHYDAQQMRDYASFKTQQIHKLVSECYVGASREEDQGQSGEHEKAIALLGVENLDLAEVQIHDIFECHKCNMIFHEKDTYLQHILSFHQRTTRRYKIGSSVGDGVIVKDGKYECQFCHEVFDERRLYIGHVGTCVKGIEESPGDMMALQKRSDSPTNNELPVTVSRMDALIEIAQNSIRETSPGLDDETSGRCILDQNMASNPELLASVSDHELKSNSSPIGPCIESSLEPHQQKVDYMIVDEITEQIDDPGIVLKDKIDSSGNERHGNGAVPHHGKEYVTLCTVELGKSVIEPKTDSECHFLAPSNIQKPSSNESNAEMVFADKHDKYMVEDVDKTRCVEIEVDVGSNNRVADNNIVKEILQQPLKDNELSHAAPQLHVALMQSSSIISTNTVSFNEIDLSAMDNKRDDKVTVFEDLKLDEIEQLKFSFKSEIEVPLHLANNSEMEREFDASVQFESDVTVDDAGGQHFTTMCVWCGIEFIHEAAETELQSDSVGYMCSSCKANICGTLNMWGKLIKLPLHF
ncbi:methyl-CPG-binding domain 8 [Euphorbia peplus]|nr:methyl-CPG-binding domain 8 [Euphorbia peplus]